MVSLHRKNISEYLQTIPSFKNTHCNFSAVPEPAGRFAKKEEGRLPGHVTVSGNPDTLDT